MARPKLQEHEKLVVRTFRLTRVQDDRLRRAAAHDGLPSQEHIRRALDGYLYAVERAYNLPSTTPTQDKETNHASS